MDTLEVMLFVSALGFLLAALWRNHPLQNIVGAGLAGLATLGAATGLLLVACRGPLERTSSGLFEDFPRRAAWGVLVALTLLFASRAAGRAIAQWRGSDWLGYRTIGWGALCWWVLASAMGPRASGRLGTPLDIFITGTVSGWRGHFCVLAVAAAALSSAAPMLVRKRPTPEVKGWVGPVVWCVLLFFFLCVP